MDRETLKAGIAREIISPPKGIYQIGYGDRVHGNKGIHDDLTATCLFLTNETVSLAWVAVDMLCLNEYIVDQIQNIVGSDITVLISCSHTHSGPIAYADSSSPKNNREYIQFLINQIVKCIQDAQSTQVKAALTWAEGKAEIAVNRREKKADGTVEIGINPDGPIDQSLYTLSVFNEKQERLATLVNFAAHGTVQGPKNLLISGDWMGAMRQSLEKTLDSPVLFIQGATADLNPHHAWEADEISWLSVKNQGQQVAEQVLSAIEKKFEFSNLPFNLSQTEIWIPLETKVKSKTPPKTYRKEVVKMGGLPRWLSFMTDYLLNKRYPWRSRIEAANGYWSIPLRITAVQIGQIGVIALNAETFTQIGLTIKEKSPFTFTILASVSNGCIGYLPTAEAHQEGGYEVDLAPYSYRYPGRLNKNAADQVIQTSCDILQFLKNLN
ncbi:MAG: hypothetical protein CL609_14720 [Anaerolineaceae bacterium]|nr:hypothetical protein [Anaerolineaceae bacterium]